MDPEAWAAVLGAIGGLVAVFAQARKAAAETRKLRQETERLGDELAPERGSRGSMRETIDRIERTSSEAKKLVGDVHSDYQALRRELQNVRGELRDDREAVHLIRQELIDLRAAVSRHLTPFRRWKR